MLVTDVVCVGYLSCVGHVGVLCGICFVGFVVGGLYFRFIAMLSVFDVVLLFRLLAFVGLGVVSSDFVLVVVFCFCVGLGWLGVCASWFKWVLYFLVVGVL